MSWDDLRRFSSDGLKGFFGVGVFYALSLSDFYKTVAKVNVYVVFLHCHNYIFSEHELSASVKLYL